MKNFGIFLLLLTISHTSYALNATAIQTLDVGDIMFSSMASIVMDTSGNITSSGGATVFPGTSQPGIIRITDSNDILKNISISNIVNLGNGDADLRDYTCYIPGYVDPAIMCYNLNNITIPLTTYDIYIGATLYLPYSIDASDYGLNQDTTSTTIRIGKKRLRENLPVEFTYIVPISLTENSDLSFGNIVIDSFSDSLIRLNLDDSVTAVSGSAYSISNNNSAASFTITGSANYIINISLPTDGTVVMTGTGNPLSVNNFQHSAGVVPTLDGTGSLTFTVGADVIIPSTQLSGSYSGTFDVSVDYQ